MEQFISCDWGTSGFRLRLINAVSNEVLAESISAQGIAATYALWKEQIFSDRISFYTEFILERIKLIEKQCESSLDDVPVVLSGMASSSIGMLELPYKKIPYKINKTSLETHSLSPSGKCRHEIIIISGVCSQNDVMRGEETILAGCSIDDQVEEQLFIFPGTHSKHIVVQEGMVKAFKTYMTGELFSLLSSKSILAASVEEDGKFTHPNEFFIKGVNEILSSNLLNSLFHVRTNELFSGLSKKENYYYLSGLLIGEELKYIQRENYTSVVVVSTGPLCVLYTAALSAMGLKNKVSRQNSDKALINGQAFIFNYYKK